MPTTETCKPMRFLMPGLLLALLTAAWAAPLCAQAPIKQYSNSGQGVDVVERIGSPLPLDTPFVDDNARNVTLARYFGAGKPVLISLNYSECPRLCDLQLTELARALREISLKPGDDFELVTISIDPSEGYKRARHTKVRYLNECDNAAADKGWHFLTTDNEADVRKVADALGFSYVWDETTKEYQHKAALFVATPKGVISHYVHGMGYEPALLETSLKAAAKGELGLPSSAGFGADCFTNDYTENVARAFGTMRWAGVGVLALVVGFVGYFWVREARKRKTISVQVEVTQ